MPNTTRLPRLTIAGLDPFNEAMEAYASAIERSLNLDGSGGVTVDKTATGATVKGGTTHQIRTMTVTTAIPKKVGTVCGKGAAKDCVFDAPTAALTAGTGTAVDIYNYHTDKGFIVGAVIATYEEYGVRWVFDVDACANLSS